MKYLLGLVLIATMASLAQATVSTCIGGQCPTVDGITYGCDTANDRCLPSIGTCTNSQCTFPGFQCISGHCLYTNSDVSTTGAVSSTTTTTATTTTTTTTTRTTTATTTTTISNCVDLAAPGKPSDCPAMAKYCTDPIYLQLMREQCPKTCGYCTASGTSVCVDRSAQGRPSDCPKMASYCTNAIYANLMRQECPKTCGYC